MNFSDFRITPAMSLIAPGCYHLSRGRYQAGIIWTIAVLVLVPTVVFGIMALLLCYKSAQRLSKTWSFPPDSLSAALDGLPTPSTQWIHTHTNAVRIQIPERGENESLMSSEQRERILELAMEMDPKTLDELGEAQAASLIEQLTPRQAEFSKDLLIKFFSEKGYCVSDSLVTGICDYYRGDKFSS